MALVTVTINGRDYVIVDIGLRMVGNSVNPMMAVGFLRANAPWLAVGEQEAA